MDIGINIIPLYKADYNTCYERYKLSTGDQKEVVISYGWEDWKRQLERVRQQKEDIQKVVE